MSVASRARYQALAVEAAHQNALTQDMAVNRFQNVGARGVGSQVKLGIQRV
jgi:hypothetical protein